MVWICVRCENIQCNFMAWTFALIRPVQPILHWIYCRNKTIPNTPNHYEMQQKLSLGSNGVDQVRSLGKLSTHQFSPFCTEFRAVTKWSQMHPNTMKRTKRPYGVNRVDLLQKILTQLCGLNFCINFNSSARFEPSIVKQRNGPKWTNTTKQNKT